MRIGVFDSGIGGESVAKAIKQALPEHEILVREDRENLPYGTKTIEKLYELVSPIFRSMVEDGCDVIVVACNTVSTNLIEKLRNDFPDTPLIAVEPMIKPAAELTKSGVIAVCATPATLRSVRYADLKRQFAAGITVLEPDCSDWASMIEHNRVDSQMISTRLSGALDQGADVIVLGCTHYHWIEDIVTELCSDRAKVLQPEQAIVQQVHAILMKLDYERSLTAATN